MSDTLSPVGEEEGSYRASRADGAPAALHEGEAGGTGPLLPTNHRARAERFHRRAQKAESVAIRAANDARHWKAAWLRATQRTATLWHTNARLSGQVLASRRRDALTRIIELGQQFP